MNLTPVAQALLLLRAAPTPEGLPPDPVFALLALVIPFGCYLWGLHDAPLAPARAPAIVRRLLVLGAGAALTVAGYAYGSVVIAETVTPL
ncbi:MAG: hypothetical protein ACK45B_04155 [Limisphaerales bacterium]